ncbi:MAG: right-handed parallel beta-helix repeat-containing protein [Sedimentisphaerales bacterium]|nr:right-handed parallel beta-helix repeat-containing protein [Sedimentisphaerales bacterium]
MSNYFKLLLVACVVAFGAFSVPLAATTYYVDSDTGNDGNGGLSPEDAWASFTNVNATVLGAGDMVLLKAGTSYTGQLKPQGSGTPESPIIIDMYGNGYRPRIDGQGSFGMPEDNVFPGAVIHLCNMSYIEVSNLEITNQGATREVGRYGVAVTVWNGTISYGIRLNNLFVHDINGTLVKEDRQEGSGIYFDVNGSGSKFDGLIIENCYVLRTDRNGINSFTGNNRRTDNFDPSPNVIIRGNTVEDCGGDAIKVWGCLGALVEYNFVNGACERCEDLAAGIWPFSSDNTVIQFNEVCNLKSIGDGQAFDADYNCQNSLFQYNYSHDNQGGFFMACGKEPTAEIWGSLNSVFRYNVSQNDGVAGARVFNISGGGVENTHIYNNTVYVGPGQDLPLFVFGSWGGFADSTYIYNNVFYVDGHVTYDIDPRATNTVFDYNVYYGNHTGAPSDAHAIYTNPMLVNPGNAPTPGFYALDEYYEIQAGSPCIDSGMEIADNGGVDYWGHSVPYNSVTDRGAHEYRVTEPDSLAPTPDPMTWVLLPYSISDGTISMSATVAYDESNVQYYFTCTAGGGNDSGWQNSPLYTDTGLLPDTQYTYAVKARDKSAALNETVASSAESATTFSADDYTAPTPDPMTWQTVPYGSSDATVLMEATTAFDMSGVEYYFTCTAGGGNDSGWQSNPVYEDTGLTPETNYTYTVKARDMSSNNNETAESTAETGTTLPVGGEPTVYVYDIGMGYRYTGFYYTQATVWIKDINGADIQGAVITAEWQIPKRNGYTISVATASTGSDGTVMMESAACKVDGTVYFTITDVSASGYTYDPALNNETADSITYPQ